MKANSTHISLETAKLLKDCKLNSSAYYCNEKLIRKPLFRGKTISAENEIYPAYTWQEILWEYPQEFFGSDLWFDNHNAKWWIYSDSIFRFLQKKKYDEVDQYFRDNCILIN